MKVSPMPRFRPLPALCLAAVLALPGLAQAQTVADIRAEVDVLNGQVQQLRDELVRQGAAGGLPVAPATALERLDQLEAELRQLTNRVDVLTNDIDRIVKDATNRVGDIEFRLTELVGELIEALVRLGRFTGLLAASARLDTTTPRGTK